MFSIIKSIIWIVGLIVVSLFVLNYFGYEVNKNYFNASKSKCQEKLNACAKNLVEQGTKNVQCNFECVDPSLIIKKK